MGITKLTVELVSSNNLSHTQSTQFDSTMPPKKSAKPVKSDDEAPKEKKQNGLTKPMTLSSELAAIVGAKKDEKLARSEIVKRLWAYLKEKQLQDPENKQYFTPDELMQPVFGTEKMRAFAMSKYLKDHLS